MTKYLRRFSRLALGVLIVALVVVLAPLWLPEVLWLEIRESRRARRFVREHRGRTLLVWHSRRGWHDFCVNQLLQALPPGVEAVRDPSPRVEAQAGIRRVAEHKAGLHQFKRPYLLHFSPSGPVMISLNEALQPLKPYGAVNPEVRRRVSTIVADALEKAQAAA